MTPKQKRRVIQDLVDQSGPTAEQRERINKITGNRPREIADGTTVMDAVKGANPLLAGYRAARAIKNKVVKPAFTATGKALRNIVSKVKS